MIKFTLRSWTSDLPNEVNIKNKQKLKWKQPMLQIWTSSWNSCSQAELFYLWRYLMIEKYNNICELLTRVIVFWRSVAILKRNRMIRLARRNNLLAERNWSLKTDLYLSRKNFQWFLKSRCHIEMCNQCKIIKMKTQFKNKIKILKT